MTLKDNFTNGFNNIVRQAGTQIRVRYYSQTIGSVWDDEVVLSQSGTDLWTSGVVFPVGNQGRSRASSEESVLLEEGKLIDSDKRLYVNGSLTFTSGNFQVDVQLGSPTGQLFTTIPLGGIMQEVEGQKIFKKQYIRRLTNGSLVGV